MSGKIRLGPIAIFLTIIAAVLASLAMLTIATTRADDALAERFARVTQIRYELEAEGNRFLMEADEYYSGSSGLPEGAWEAGDTIGYYVEREGYTLDIEVIPDGDTYKVTVWKITKQWEADDPFENLWLG